MHITYLTGKLTMVCEVNRYTEYILLLADTVHVDVRLNSIELPCCDMSPSAYRLLRFSALFFKAHLLRSINSCMDDDHFHSTQAHAARLPLQRELLIQFNGCEKHHNPNPIQRKGIDMIEDLRNIFHVYIVYLHPILLQSPSHRSH